MSKLTISEKRPKVPSDIYKVEPVENGWQIFYYFPRGQYAGVFKRPVDDGFVYKQRQSAYLRCKRLNDTRHSANFRNLSVKIRAQRQDCQKILARLRTNVARFIVHDPLEDSDIRYITCQQRCRFSDQDFDPHVNEWQPQPPVEKDFRTFLNEISQMPEVESLEIAEHSFQMYYPTFRESENEHGTQY